MSIAEKSVPPLLAGDRMTRDEFMRRWESHPEITHAELIGGIVYMPSPVGLRHGFNDLSLGGWLMSYWLSTPGTQPAHNATILLIKDAPQPDVLLRILEDYGGSSTLKGDYLHGPPEFIGEICHSSAAYDLHQKLELYERAGVKEYLAILLYEDEIRWHVLGSNGYEVVKPDSDGVRRSRVFPGLWLEGSAFLTGKMSEVMAVLNQGLQGPEHARFVADLAARKKA